jgi:hypothetical protein
VALGQDPRYVMGQLGHTDPAFTLRLYTHAMQRDGERERGKLLVGGVVPEQTVVDAPNDLLVRPAESLGRGH